MSWKSSVILVAVFLGACQLESTPSEVIVESAYLLEADEMIAMSGRPHMKVVDFRKKGDHEKEHIQGAVNIWRSDIEDTSYPYGGVMASSSQIEALFGKLGISTEDTIIIYDDSGLCNAARLWWILQNYDHENVRMLHGGIAAWKAVNGMLSTGPSVVEEAVFKLAKDPSMRYYVSKEQVQLALASKTVILDTRTTDEFSGSRQKKGATKGGRISGSIHIDWAEAIDLTGDQRMRTVVELERIYAGMNISKDDPLIVYCHSGVRSAHTTFVLTQLMGYKNVKNYDGSWTEWSYYDDLPFEVDGPTRIEQ